LVSGLESALLGDAVVFVIDFALAMVGTGAGGAVAEGWYAQAGAEAGALLLVMVAALVLGAVDVQVMADVGLDVFGCDGRAF
jgi:hypothetical protein